jgi:glucokinase
MGTSLTTEDYLAGVDLGGTKIMAGIFNSALEPVAHSKIKTKSLQGPHAVVERVAKCVREALQNGGLDTSRLKAIGIGAPGAVDPDTGRVLFAPNLGWKEFPLRAELEALLEVPVLVENDCNICTLGVHTVELGGQPKDLVGIFLGTGIGCGIIIDGRLYSGFNRTAGEIGHMVIDLDGPVCGCGNRGCFEALAGRQALFNRIRDAVQKGQKTVLTEMLGPDLHDLRSGKLRKAIALGDAFVKQVVEEASFYTGVAVGNIINLINPEFVVLGGGLIEQLEDEMMGVIVDTARKYAMTGTAQGISIQPSKLADDAGIVGGAVLAARFFQ